MSVETMKKRGWKNIIIDQMLKKGLDDEIANPNIETLAEIMAERDETYKAYQKTGGHPVISHTNKGGATNLEKNPLLKVWIDLNQLSLTYWRELGLTPSSFKKLTEMPLAQKKKEDPVENKIMEILNS